MGRRIDRPLDDATSTATRFEEQLSRTCARTVALLHRRRSPRIGRVFDHIAVAPSGVWIVTSHGHAGRVAGRRPIFGPPRLSIGGRDRSDLLLELDRQATIVRSTLALEHPDVAVRSAICFVDTEEPAADSPNLGAYLFFGTPSLVRHLSSDGPLRPERVRTVAALLGARFPQA